MPLRHHLSFTEDYGRFLLLSEEVTHAEAYRGESEPRMIFKSSGEEATLNPNPLAAGTPILRRVAGAEYEKNLSALAQFRDRVTYNDLTHLARVYEGTRIYRDWALGRSAPARQPQRTDVLSDVLEEDLSNLAVVLNKLSEVSEVRSAILKHMERLLRGTSHFGVSLQPGVGQIFLHENGMRIPALRLSDGTLRALALMTILCDPRPPPLICLEEPELGLHPDAVTVIADLLREASKRCQIIVTTHSEVLVDAFSEEPEAIIVFEKDDERGTRMQRLSKEKLSEWLKEYSLNTLWRMGMIGGNRW
ncbi:AAA family ATPase [Candidatus Poribacteria bacterium]|nr:AAA family ATPase [Candidatus Poribacteria bacterium]